MGKVNFLSFSKIIFPLGVNPKKYFEIFHQVEVHAKLGWNPSSSLGSKSEQKKQKNKQTNRQASYIYIYIYCRSHLDTPGTVILRTFFLRFKFTIDGGIEVLDRINVELGPYDELDRNPGT